MAASPVTATTAELHRTTLVFDGLALSYILDESYTERVLEGGVNACIVTFAAEEDWGTRLLWDATLRLVEAGLKKVASHPLLALATRVEDIIGAHAAGKLAVVMGFQSAAMIGKDFWRLSLLYRLGLRCLQLTYSGADLYGDGSGERRDGGLTTLGAELIQAVNELGMLLDLSHCGERTTREAIELARMPVCTHANAYSLNPNPRCKTDDIVKALATKGGMIGVQCAPRLVKPNDPSVEDVVDHIDHFVSLVGAKHVGLGLGFTEGFQERGEILPQSVRWRTLRPDVFGPVDDFVHRKYPRGIESIQSLPNLTQVLVDRGYGKEQITEILGGNWLRTIRDAFG